MTNNPPQWAVTLAAPLTEWLCPHKYPHLPFGNEPCLVCRAKVERELLPIIAQSEDVKRLVACLDKMARKFHNYPMDSTLPFERCDNAICAEVKAALAPFGGGR